MDIAKLDKNFAIDPQEIKKPDVKFHSIWEEPFKVYGVIFENERFRRMPEEVANSVNEGVKHHHKSTAGGRVKFITDSPYVAVYAKLSMGKMAHFALAGSAGFDLTVYKDGKPRYAGSYIPHFGATEMLEGVVNVGEGKKELLLTMPLYSGIKELYIGLAESAVIEAPTPYRVEKPVVYYGSSITQGGCASTPSTSYQALVSMALDCNYINLGFSGNAKGEDNMSNYIKNLEMSAFVYDYDHNAPSTEHLQNTHKRMFDIIRSANPTLPIIMMNRPKCYLNEDEKKRLEIIESTYIQAKAAGDKNVYLITNKELTELCLDRGTVDGCHPTDLGFASMAAAVIRVMKDIL